MIRGTASIVLLACLVPLAAASAQAHPGPMQLRDYRALVRIASPEFSPDGGRLAYLAVRADFARDRYDATLLVSNASGGSAKTLVRGMPGLEQPHWSPDGRSLAFIAEAAGRGPQIFLVPAGGGRPRQLGNAPNGVEQFSWSPDGRTMAVVTPDSSPLGAPEVRAHHDLFTIQDDDYLIERPPVPSHIWLMTVGTGRSRRLTRGTTSVLEGPPPFAGGVSAPSWSADGRWIAYAQQANAHDARTDLTRIVAVSVASGEEHPLTANTSYEYVPRFAPRGAGVAWLYPHGPGPVSVMDLFVGSPEGGTARDVSGALDRDVGAGFAWLPDGSGLVGIANDGIRQRLYVQPLAGAGRALDLGDSTLSALEVAVSARGALAVVADGAGQGPELYLLASAGGDARPTRLTDLNRGFAAYAWPRSAELKWTAPGGEANDGILTYPEGYEPGRRYPLVVFSHGGPEAASTLDFDAGEVGPLRDRFAADGYLVFEPNYRGSDNLGNAHEHAIYRDPGEGPDSDVISGIRMLETQGVVDTARIAAVGHSYGGYLTTWLIGHHHFWRCAVVADGVTDWTQEYELSGAGNLAWTSGSLGGSPWDSSSAELYRSGSPITYAGQITTPTLILSGTADITVPITESFALYHALAGRDVPVEFIGIPGAHHSPQDPVHRELYYQAIETWVVRHLGQATP